MKKLKNDESDLENSDRIDPEKKQSDFSHKSSHSENVQFPGLRSSNENELSPSLEENILMPESIVKGRLLSSSSSTEGAAASSKLSQKSSQSSNEQQKFHQNHFNDSKDCGRCPMFEII